MVRKKYTTEEVELVSDKLSAKYLGDTDVVVYLVAAFCTEAESLMYSLRGGELAKDKFVQKSKALVRNNADIFSGKNPDYKIIEGHNNGVLAPMLKAVLGDYWESHRQTWDDDSVAVLFQWLFAMIAEKTQRADGDDMLLEVMLKPSIQQTVQLLLGSGKKS